MSSNGGKTEQIQSMSSLKQYLTDLLGQIDTYEGALKAVGESYDSQSESWKSSVSDAFASIGTDFVKQAQDIDNDIVVIKDDVQAYLDKLEETEVRAREELERVQQIQSASTSVAPSSESMKSSDYYTQ